MKGILLAGGMAKRFRPATQVVSKQLLCVYDKPLIYYPLTTLLEMGIRDIAIIATEETVDIYRKLLGDGSRFGAALTYLTQPEPGGVAQAFLIARHFIREEHVCLLLGDNIFINTHLDRISSCGSGRGGRVYIGQYAMVSPITVWSGGLYPGLAGSFRLEEKPEKPQSRYHRTRPVFLRCFCGTGGGETAGFRTWRIGDHGYQSAILAVTKSCMSSSSAEEPAGLTPEIRRICLKRLSMSVLDKSKPASSSAVPRRLLTVGAGSARENWNGARNRIVIRPYGKYLIRLMEYA